MRVARHACYRDGVDQLGGVDHPAPLWKEDRRSVEEEASGHAGCGDVAPTTATTKLMVAALLTTLTTGASPVSEPV
jgi:hypothetical protein